MTKLGSSLPKGDSNGIGAISRALIDTPEFIHVCLVLIDCKKTVVDHDTGELEATARIRRIEVVMPRDHAVAEQLMRRSFENRTGKTTLPFDLETDLNTAFHGVDPSTGQQFPFPRNDDPTDG